MTVQKIKVESLCARSFESSCIHSFDFFCNRLIEISYAQSFDFCTKNNVVSEKYSVSC